MQKRGGQWGDRKRERMQKRGGGGGGGRRGVKEEGGEEEEGMWKRSGELHLHGRVDSREDCVPSKHKGQEAKGHGEVTDVNGMGVGQLQHVHTDRGVEDSGSCEGEGPPTSGGEARRTAPP